MLASLQTLLFSDRDKAPTASEVTYNYVLECAVIELQNRDRAQRGQDVDASGLDSVDRSEGPAADPADPAGGGDTEKHKIKEQQRRAKKRQLLTQLQTLVMGDSDVAPKSKFISGNCILELVVEQLQKERDRRISGTQASAAEDEVGARSLLRGVPEDRRSSTMPSMLPLSLLSVDPGAVHSGCAVPSFSSLPLVPLPVGHGSSKREGQQGQPSARGSKANLCSHARSCV